MLYTIDQHLNTFGNATGGTDMSTATVPSERKTMTAEQLMSLPDDGVRREIVRGTLWERPKRFRTPIESAASANLCALLASREDRRSEPRRDVLGQFCFRLQRNPDMLLFVDVSLVSRSAEWNTATGPGESFHDGPPDLAGLILAWPDTQGEIVDRITLLLEVGTVVWVVNPDFQTVCVHRPGHPPLMVNETQELSGEPYLPGFLVPVARIFE